MKSGFNLFLAKCISPANLHLMPSNPGSLTSEFAPQPLQNNSGASPLALWGEKKKKRKKKKENSREFCGQRNAAHIFAIAAAEVMRRRVGACRGERASLRRVNTPRVLPLRRPGRFSLGNAARSLARHRHVCRSPPKPSSSACK